ncbi:hypothetical protein ACLSYV_03775 [Avibacterium avium]|uniref:hypothetical protein n=1 Tax=Avibacterium avium TaxID=751 RepID=UPI003BF8930D
MRKIIQICSDSYHNSETGASAENLFALCDDGSVWRRIELFTGWERLEPIPQDSLEYEHYLTSSINKLLEKDRNNGLSKEEIQDLKDLLKEQEDYELYGVRE